MAARKILLVRVGALLRGVLRLGSEVRRQCSSGSCWPQLAGSYDNLAQSRASPDHAPLRLMIAPVQAPLVGEHVFYVQEMAADDPRRVLAQHLYVVESGARSGAWPC